MANRHALSVQEFFSTANRLEEPGVQGYQIHKKYFDPLQEIAQRELLKKQKGVKDRRHVTKRGNYLQDEQKLHKSVPGPGQYPTRSLWSEKAKLKIRYSEKKTYVDDIYKYQKKWKIPAPGHYNVVKSMKELEAEKKLMAVKKRNYQDRLTFLDDVQLRSTQTPGTGMYNPRDRIKTEYSKFKTKPEEWRKKHEEQAKKKPPKSPEVAAYSPMPVQYNLFDHLTKIKKSKSNMSKTIRFKTSPIGSGLPPAKYSVMQQWRGKDKKKIAVHGFEALSRTSYKSVYYH